MGTQNWTVAEAKAKFSDDCVVFQQPCVRSRNGLPLSIQRWLQDELPLRFEGRILPVDAVIADAWGRTASLNEAVGRPIEAMDALLAATAETHRMTLVTRKVSDFSLLKSILNPWT